MRIAIIQSCYIPWRGFFDLIGRCDEYVVYDRAQFVKRHWHNRNRIKTAAGCEWLTIPVISKGRYDQPIDAVEVSESWADKHWRAVELSYRRAQHFEAYAGTVRGWYERVAKERLLTEINLIFFVEIAKFLGIATRIVRDTVYPASGVKSERLLAIVSAAGADQYLSGPSAKAYLDEALFAEAGVSVEWMSYQGYRDYPQLYGEFEPAVSILDLIFNVGPEAPRYVHPGVG
jgi:hypothetical protein